MLIRPHSMEIPVVLGQPGLNKLMLEKKTMASKEFLENY